MSGKQQPTNNNDGNNNNKAVGSVPGVPVQKTVDNDGPVPVTVAATAAAAAAAAHYNISDAPPPPPFEWSTGVCDCATDPDVCWDTCLCHPCSLALLFNKAVNEQDGVHWPLCAGVALCDLFLTGGLAMWAEAMYIRARIRARYSVRHDDAPPPDNCTASCLCEDLCITFWCLPCSTCQARREMTVRGEWPGKVLIGTDPAGPALETPSEVTIV